MTDNGAPGGSFDNWAFPPQPPSWPSLPPSTPPKRTSRGLTLTAAIAATVLIGAVGGVAVAFATRTQSGATPAPGAAQTPIPGRQPSAALALYQQVLTTVKGATGFHYANVATGPDSETITGDATQTSGRQLITFNSSYGAEQFTLLLINGTVYFQGNAPAVEDQIGVATADAKALTNRWVAVSATDGPYTVLQPGITVADQAQEIVLLPTSKTSVTTAGGTSATRILGTIPGQGGAPSATAHIDVLSTSNIPVVYGTSFTTNGVTVTNTTTFSAWGTAATVTAPTGAVAWSSLATSVPPGGYGSGGATSAGPTPTPRPAI